MVHFKKVGLTLLIQDDVKAKYLEAHQILEVCGLTSPVVMNELLLDWKHCLHNYVLYFAHKLVWVLIVTL